ncbi:MAG: HAD hydrolase-like protein [Candidatus Dormibacteraeota bacterium]|nr:HAD hydrolase-like protein [Candidatus Dormibacteraeota bacterium]
MSSAGWLVLDLDGTIVDIRPRHYAAHLLVTRDLGLQPIGPAAYWRIKRAGLDVASRYGGRGREYRESFLDWIEAVELLDLDRPFSRAREWLTDLQSRGFGVVIATGRRNRARTRTQLEGLAIPHDLLVTVPNSSRSAAVLSAIDSPVLAWIGDTEIDIEAGRDLGVLTVAVTSGIRSPSLLARHRPDALVARLSDVRFPPEASTPIAAAVAAQGHAFDG